MATDTVLELTDENFEQEVIQSDKPVLVDFWAEWCMPCRMVAPYVDELAQQYEGRLKVGKVDTESNRDISAKLQIASIPTIMLFKDGQVVSQIVGARPSAKALADELKIDEALG